MFLNVGQDLSVDNRAAISIVDAPENWRLADGRYNVKVTKWDQHRVLFEIVGGEHDGENYGIETNSLPLTQA